MGRLGCHFRALLTSSYVVAIHRLQIETPPSDVKYVIADSAPTVHATDSGIHVYSRRPLTQCEATLLVDDGRAVMVECYRNLDMVFHCKRRPPARVAISGARVLHSLKFDLFSPNKVDEMSNIFTDHTGTYTLDHKMHFKNFLTNKDAGTMHVPYLGDPPTMLTALMRPGPQRSIDVYDLHASLRRIHDANFADTARQNGLKMTGYSNYCGDYGALKAIKTFVANSILCVTERQAERL